MNDKERIQGLEKGVKTIVTAPPQASNKGAELTKWFDEAIQEGGTASTLVGETALKQVGNRIQERSKHRLPSMMFVFKDETVRKKLVESLRAEAARFYDEFACAVLIETNEDGSAVKPVDMVARGQSKTREFFTQSYPKIRVHEVSKEIADNKPGQQVEFGDEHLAQDAFIPLPELQAIVSLLKVRRNVILQGPPGVGKSFLAQRIAYSAMGESVTSRVLKLQFHPGYSYEEFIEGYRPIEGSTGTEFGLVPGSLKRFVTEVESTYGNKPCVLILDEINRSNLSTVFGESMSLIEADKRSKQYEVRTLYSGEPFHLPDNLLVLGLMNTADRSIALVDYALRRRFAFVDLPPRFNQLFREYLQSRGIVASIVDHLFAEIEKINSTVRESAISLGRGFEIGHSYFCNGPDLSKKDEDERKEEGWNWLRGVVRYDIAPLLREYWFDDRDTRATLIESLFGKKLSPEQVRELVD